MYLNKYIYIYVYIHMNNKNTCINKEKATPLVCARGGVVGEGREHYHAPHARMCVEADCWNLVFSTLPRAAPGLRSLSSFSVLFFPLFHFF